jgi:hypothetical protein
MKAAFTTNSFTDGIKSSSGTTISELQEANPANGFKVLLNC